MSWLHDSAVGDFTRGGQLATHFLRMIGQVIDTFGRAMLLLYFVGTVAIWWHQTSDYERHLGYRYAMANGACLLGNGEKQTALERPDHTLAHGTFRQIAESEPLHNNLVNLGWSWLAAMATSAASVLLILVTVLAWLYVFGRAQRREQVLRGVNMLDAAGLAGHLKKAGVASELRVAGIPLVKHSETQHVSLQGAPGTGKTSTIHELMKRIRRRGDRVVCYSPSGDFIEWFYRPGVDTLLNPFDERCPSWNLWEECEAPYHYDMIANAMIPEPVHDPIWNNAARSLVAVLAAKMKERGNTSIGDLLKLITAVPMEQIHAYLADTEVAANLDPKNEKMGANIRSTAAIYARAFKYVREDAEPFNIRRWVASDQGSSWIFLNAKADQLGAVRPLLTTWLEIFVNSLLSLPESRTRRVWLIVDELPSLNKVPSLYEFLAQSRKFGGCGVIAFQQPSQLREKYGKDGAENFAGLCGTRVTMRANDVETATWAARSFGQVEIMESQQGLSYGANDMRDGVSLSQQRKVLDILMPAEVMNLDDLEGYIKLKGAQPTAKFRMTRRTIRKVAEAFVPRLVATDTVLPGLLGDEDGSVAVPNPPPRPAPDPEPLVVDDWATRP